MVMADLKNSAERKLVDWLVEQKLDGILLRKRNNFSWVTQGKVNHIVNATEDGVADLLIMQNKKYCITTKMEARRIMEEELDGLGYELVGPEWYEGTDEAIAELIRDKKIVSDSNIYGLEDVTDALIELRSQLTDAEVEKYKWLCQKAGNALETVVKAITPGMSEHEIAAELAPVVMKEGINPQVILVATDERIHNYRHPIPTDKKLEKYAMVVLCAEKWGLVANVTRFVHFGELPEELKENRKKLAKIDIIMNTGTRPGVTAGEIINKALEAYAEAGFPEDWRLLHQGGLTGYSSREFLATMHHTNPVKVNQAYAWNPAIRGVKSEDTILVGETENEFLTHTGNWVYIEVEHEGKIYKRPDILIK